MQKIPLFYVYKSENFDIRFPKILLLFVKYFQVIR